MDKYSFKANRRKNNYSPIEYRKAAHWAANLYHSLGLPRNIHPRRLHYTAITMDRLLLPSGKPYQNTQPDFRYLEMAFEQARFRGYIPYDIFSDDCVPTQSNSALSSPAHIELWLENTNASHLVAPLAQKYSLNILAYPNSIPLTCIWRFTKRAVLIDRPIRIFYLADFNRHKATPSAIDKLHCLINQYGHKNKLDLKTINIGLSYVDCIEYGLPNSPENHDITELNALDTVAPGIINQTLFKHISYWTG